MRFRRQGRGLRNGCPRHASAAVQVGDSGGVCTLGFFDSFEASDPVEAAELVLAPVRVAGVGGVGPAAGGEAGADGRAAGPDPNVGRHELPEDIRVARLEALSPEDLENNAQPSKC